MKNLTNETFKEKIFDYEKINESTDIEMKNDKPSIIVFSAVSWCVPCKTLAPVMEELSNEYDSLVDIYDVDVDTEQELSGAFGIKSVPSILFIPTDGTQPQMAQGALPKTQLIESIKTVFKVEK